MAVNSSDKKKFLQLKKAVSHLANAAQRQPMTPVEEAGTIKFFELSYELSWKCLKLVLTKQGLQTTSPRNTLNKAYQVGLIAPEDEWLKMIQTRNLSAHVYNDEGIDKLMIDIKGYIPLFEDLISKLEEFHQS